MDRKKQKTHYQANRLKMVRRKRRHQAMYQRMLKKAGGRPPAGNPGHKRPRL